MDADEFLLDFHRANPGITAVALARGRTADGRSSYDVLRDVVPPDCRVLELGCGDGYLLERFRARGEPAAHLAGIDMSPDELAAARRRSALAGVALHHGRAQALPLGDSSFEAVVSHMAFMLMRETEAVVAEIARVLVPGGRFAAIVGGGPRAGDTFERFLDLMLPRYRAHGRPIPPLVDRRTGREDGLAELFTPGAGFAPPRLTDLYLSLDGPFDAVWASIWPVYESHVLADADRLALEAALRAACARDFGADGIVPCTMALRLLVVERVL